MYSLLFLILISCDYSGGIADSQLKIDKPVEVSNTIPLDICEYINEVHSKFINKEYYLNSTEPFLYVEENNGKYVGLLTRMKEDDGTETEGLKLYLIDRSREILMEVLYYGYSFSNVEMVAKVVVNEAEYHMGKIDLDNICSVKSDWPTEYVDYIVNEIKNTNDSIMSHYSRAPRFLWIKQVNILFF